MAKKKKKIEKEMSDLDLVGVSISPIVATKRKKKMSGGKTMKPAKTRYTYNKGSKVNPNEGIEALRKEAPEVVERMGYQEGKEVSDMLSIEAANEMIAPIYVELLQIEESLKDKQGLTNIPQTTQRKKELEPLLKLQEKFTINSDSEENEDQAAFNSMIEDISVFANKSMELSEKLMNTEEYWLVKTLSKWI